MSVKIISWVFQHSMATLGSRLVLLAIADYAHDDGGGAWPSIQTLAEKAHLSERQVQYSIRQLVALGELVIEDNAGPRGVHLYRVCIGGAESAPVQSTTVRGEQTAPKPSLEPSKETNVSSLPSRAREQKQKKFDWETWDDIPEGAQREIMIAFETQHVPHVWIHNHVNDALNHVARRKALDTVRYLKTWLRNDLVTDRPRSPDYRPPDYWPTLPIPKAPTAVDNPYAVYEREDRWTKP